MIFNFRVKILLYLIVVTLVTCKDNDHAKSKWSGSGAFDVQGHRGCRGLLPENSLAGFLKALELGVTTLEMDVVISKDRQVLLSHEPFISHIICLDSLGQPIKSSLEKDYNIYQMNYREIAGFDCGSAVHPDFPQQEKVVTHKPLLKSVVHAVEARRRILDLDPVYYNIETKCNPLGDHVFHPEPAEFVSLLLEVVRDLGIEKHTIIQSFDPRTLQQTRIQAPELKLALLVENDRTIEENLNLLGFYPQIYSPEHILVDQPMVSFLKKHDIKLIPWTVNEPQDMRKYLDMGVDGIITDYPDLLLEILKNASSQKEK